MNYYELLEINKGASQEVIKAAYRAMVKKYHPDNFKGNIETLESKIKQINLAYETLSNLESKKIYDETLKNSTRFDKENNTCEGQNSTTQRKDEQAESKKERESVINGRNSKIPGFRTNKTWKKVIASIFYFIVAFFTIVGTIGGSGICYTTKDKWLLLAENVVFIFFLIGSPYIVFTDVLRLRKKFKFFSNKAILYVIVFLPLITIINGMAWSLITPKIQKLYSTEYLENLASQQLAAENLAQDEIEKRNTQGQDENVQEMISNKVQEEVKIEQVEKTGLLENKSREDKIDNSIEGDYIDYGNSTGNLSNAGYVAMYKDKIYYANYQRENKLYVTDKKNNYKRLCEDAVSYINVVDDWIYYVNHSDKRKLYKIRVDGTERKKVLNDSIGKMSVMGEWIYYTATGNWLDGAIYKVHISGKDKTKLIEHDIAGMAVTNKGIYFCDGMYEGYRINLDGSDLTKLTDDMVGYLNVVDEWIYYQGYDDNKTCIVRLNINDNTKEVILTEELRGGKIGSFLNVYNGWMYFNEVYQNKGLLSRAKIGEEEYQTFCPADAYDASYINIAEDWIYFIDQRPSGIGPQQFRLTQREGYSERITQEGEGIPVPIEEEALKNEMIIVKEYLSEVGEYRDLLPLGIWEGYFIFEGTYFLDDKRYVIYISNNIEMGPTVEKAKLIFE